MFLERDTPPIFFLERNSLIIRLIQLPLKLLQNLMQILEFSYESTLYPQLVFLVEIDNWLAVLYISLLHVLTSAMMFTLLVSTWPRCVQLTLLLSFKCFPMSMVLYFTVFIFLLTLRVEDLL